MSNIQSSGNLPSYREGTFDATFSGPWESNQTITCSYVVNGSIVVIDIPEVLVSSGSAIAQAQTTNAYIPAWARPLTVNKEGHCKIIDNSANVNVVGSVIIGVNGVITVNKDSVGTGQWGASGNNGWRAFSVSYCRVV